MCELFGISSKQPTTVQISLAEFARRGGATGPHIDGWGIAFFRDGDVLLIREPEPSANSAHLRFIHDQHVPSPMVISHIRRATQGSVSLRNTQPFTRELGGRPHIFAHNGDLGAIRARSDLAGGQFRVIGDTDSEYAFCYLLALLQPLWQEARPPSLEQRLAVFSSFAAAMIEFGEANFLYSDGDYLFVHSHRRRQDNGAMCPPGLHLLSRRHHEHGALAGVDMETEQEVVLLASVPLSDENWQPLPEHTVIVIQEGRVLLRRDLL
jgi:predicted glutamine amidotransferase